METILTALQQSFATWQSPSSKRRYSNSRLREQAVKCLAHCTHREVSEAIGISVSTLRSWQRSFHCNEEVVENPTFVAMSLDHIQSTDETTQTLHVLQLSLPSGILIKVESTSITSSVAFISALNKESYSCSI